MSKQPQVELPYELSYSPQQIQGEIVRIAEQVNVWAREVQERTGVELLTIPVMRGGLFFYSDLVRQLCYSVELSEVRSWAYLDRANEEPRDEVKTSLGSLDVKGRSVLVVDDICDSGRTLEHLHADLIARGASEVRAAVAVHRILSDSALSKSQYKPEWSAFQYRGVEWFVGYGMDDCGKWRNLGGIYIIPGSGKKG